MKAVFFTDRTQDIVSAPIPEGFCPEGVDLACFDDDLLYLIEHAVPSSIGGQKIFAHLLYYATLDPKTTMQYRLFHATGEYGNEAIVLINSIEALACTKDSPCAPETYHKVLLAFEAMQVIRRKFHRTYTEIRIPLGKRIIHIPSLLAGLQKMYQKHGNEKGTNKFQRFALRVAARIKSGEFAKYESSSEIACSHRVVAQVLMGFLQQHNVKEVRIPSLNEACELITQAVQSERVSAKSSEFTALLSGGTRLKTGESIVQSSEFIEGASKVQASALEREGESMATNSPTLPTFCTEKSQKRGRTRLIRLKKGDAEAIFTTNSPEFVDLERFSADLGESVAAVSFNDYISFNKITSNRDTTINDTPSSDSPVYKDSRPINAIRHDAADLAERLDGSRKSLWFPKLISCVQHFPSPVRRLAEIDVLYHSAFPDYRGKPKAPGGWFARRCEEYADPQWKIKDEIRQWDCSGMDLISIHRELQRGQRIPSAAMLPCDFKPDDTEQPESLGNELNVYADLDKQCAGPTWQEIHDVARHSLLNTRMDLVQANTLCRQIRREGQAFCEQLRTIGLELEIQAEVYPGDREGAYVVATIWEGNEEEWTNEAEWNRYFEQVKKCYQS